MYAATVCHIRFFGLMLCSILLLSHEGKEIRYNWDQVAWLGPDVFLNVFISTKKVSTTTCYNVAATFNVTHFGKSSNCNLRLSNIFVGETERKLQNNYIYFEVFVFREKCFIVCTLSELHRLSFLSSVLPSSQVRGLHQHDKELSLTNYTHVRNKQWHNAGNYLCPFILRLFFNIACELTHLLPYTIILILSPFDWLRARILSRLYETRGVAQGSAAVCSL